MLELHHVRYNDGYFHLKVNSDLCQRSNSVVDIAEGGYHQRKQLEVCGTLAMYDIIWEYNSESKIIPF
jgi:hypothetical protein